MSMIKAGMLGRFVEMLVAAATKIAYAVVVVIVVAATKTAYVTGMVVGRGLVGVG